MIEVIVDGFLWCMCNGLSKDMFMESLFIFEEFKNDDFCVLSDLLFEEVKIDSLNVMKCILDVQDVNINVKNMG